MFSNIFNVLPYEQQPWQDPGFSMKSTVFLWCFVLYVETACSWKILSKKTWLQVQPPTLLLHPMKHWSMGFSTVDHD